MLPKQPHKNLRLAFMIITQIVVIVLAIAIGYFLYSKVNKTTEASLAPTSTPIAVVTDPNAITDITWQKPQLADKNTAAFLTKNLPAIKSEFDAAPQIGFYFVGQVNSGKYAGQKLYISIFDTGTIEGVREARLLISPENKIVILSRLSTVDSGWKASTIVAFDDFSTIPTLQAPEKITDPTTKITLIKKEITSLYFPSAPFPLGADSRFVDVKKTAWIDPQWGLISESRDDLSTAGAYFMTLPDSTLVLYALEIKFVGDDHIPQITWNNGQQNTGVYSYQDRMGCGSSNLLSIMSPKDLTLADLVPAGKTSTGDIIYNIKNQNHKILKDLYATYLETTKAATPEAKIRTYQSFLVNQPVFFWLDPGGHLVKFTSQDFMPTTECGKPVIYLYPEKTTDVSVQLQPRGGFTYTEPAYGAGWQVVAEPTGRLTNKTDGKIYPYLFWEGRGDLYVAPKLGWSVARAAVPKFLEEKLGAMGLNAQEIADFKEFWVPRMQAAPFYFIGFHGNTMMNAIAPLQISPKPDTTIRVLMDFKPLQQPIAVPAPRIITPKRAGFTVVEWGGVIQ